MSDLGIIFGEGMMVRDTALSDKRVISTGSVEIDRKMGGGIPFGTLMLVEGAASSGNAMVGLVHG